jgi:hypothetical protein
VSGQWPMVAVPAEPSPVRNTASPAMSVPATPSTPAPSRSTYGKWALCEVGGKWAAIQPWAAPVYWLRYFDTFGEAKAFIEDAVAKAAICR